MAIKCHGKSHKTVLNMRNKKNHKSIMLTVLVVLVLTSGIRYEIDDQSYKFHKYKWIIHGYH